MKKENGITLIALVVTIIVLIILAGISISLVLGDNGIITKAKQAKAETEQAKVNEETGLNETSKYIDEMAENNGNTTLTIPISSLKAGDYIKYDTGINSVGTNGVVTCRVLYDASSEYGLQIISNKNIANVTLGGSDWNTGRDYYNNIITILNTEAEKYLNTKYATDVRCVGSVPTIQNGKFINKNSENVGPVSLQFTSSAEGANNMKEADTNYETDKTQMESLNIWTTGENYWVTSRSVGSGLYCGFYVRYVSDNGDLNNCGLCYLRSDGFTNGGSNTSGLRTCFFLKSDIKITGGNGTSDTPYTM